MAEKEYIKLGESTEQEKDFGEPEDVIEMIKANSSKVRYLMKDPEKRRKYDLLHLVAWHGGRELMETVIKEDLEDLKSDTMNEDNYNILNSAVEADNGETVSIILDYITKMKSEDKSIGEMLDNGCGDDLNTPLHQAYKNKNYKIMYELVKAGANPSLTNDFVFHTLHYAAADNDIEAVQAVVDGARDGGEEAEAKLQEAREQTDYNDLLPGMATEDEKMIRLLLHDVDVENDSLLEEQGSMLHYACDQNKVNLSKYLIEKAVPLNTENPLKVTPLCIATHRGYDDICIALLEAGADPNQFLLDSKLCPLNYAAKYGRARLVKELVKYGAKANRDDISEPIIHSAVSGGNCEVTKLLLEECGCEATTEYEVNTIVKKPLCIVIESGFVPLIKLLLDNGASVVESVSSFDKLKPIHVAIRSNQRHALQILLENGANPDDKTESEATPAQLTMTDSKDAANLLALLISYGISFTKRDVYDNTLLHTIANQGAVRCAEFFLKYLYDHHFNQLKGLLVEEKGLRDETPLEMAISTKNEQVLMVFFRYIMDVDPDCFRDNPSIFHKLIESELFEALKSLLDCHVYERFVDVELQPKFLDSIDSQNPYPDNPKYNHFEQSFLHKLLDCPDPLVKYHPMVSIVVREKLRFYRWWYVFTAFLYLFFLISLFYALIQASYLCDGMLLLYDDDLSKGRAFCEVVVVIYGIFFVIDIILKLLVFYIRMYRKVQLEAEESASHLNFFYKMFFRSIFRFYYISIYSWIDWWSISSLIVLIISSIATATTQWTWASFTLILFTLKLFKYARVIPSLGLYLRCVLGIVFCDVPKFCVIILILLLAYFGGIHLAARRQFSISGQAPELYDSNNCRNLSCAGTSWVNDLTKCYDLRVPLLSGVLFLIEGSELELYSFLNSNFLFTFVYLAFAFVIIVIMLNVLIAQFVFTYNRMMQFEPFHFNIELVVNCEYSSTIAFLFGGFFRRYTSVDVKTISTTAWRELCKRNPEKPVGVHIKESSESIKKHGDLIESNQQNALFNYEWIQDNVIELKRNQEKANALNLTLESKIASLEEKIIQLLNK